MLPLLCALLVSSLAAAPAPPSPGGAARAGVFDRDPDLPIVRSRVEPNLGNDALDLPANTRVTVKALVDSLGMVVQTQILKGGTPFDAAAQEAVRWWLFEPARLDGRAVAQWIAVPVDVSAPDADPVTPDMLTLARDAERTGDVRGALDAWTGVGIRVGSTRLLSDAWTPREHAIRLAARLATPPAIPSRAVGSARGAHNGIQRFMARSSNEEFDKQLSEAIAMAPWYADAYRWRAAARSMIGQRDDAMRDLVCFSLAARDSASQDLAARALRALAARDTIAAYTILK